MQISRDKKAKNQIIVLLTLTIIAYIVFVVIGMNKNKIKEGINLEERVYLNYHTYGEALSVDFKRLWNTGMYKRGGMVALKSIK